ncbi:hypothetical protein [Halobacterium sp. CBA1126]|uniref:hypothetical protein n=1 Tax=Halobacterium sp. CBA1126 TaxID=2668074 RepID=UPI0012F99264|nr:hypothetical protein [Halobacterium sp. CBA1126]MUV59885.1 hypothetical protein [Halobacterium sp. CBA1126]
MARQFDTATLVAVLACIIGVVGVVAFGWEFDSSATNPAAFALGVGVAVVAVLLRVRKRL